MTGISGIAYRPIDPDIDAAQEEEKKQQELEQQEFILRLKQAAEKKSILVLQVKGEKKGDKPETISGWVATKAIDLGEFRTMVVDIDDRNVELGVDGVDGVCYAYVQEVFFLGFVVELFR